MIGLIAGNGQFPLAVAHAARRRGMRVVAVGVREEADPELAQVVDEFHWVPVGQFGELLAVLQRAGVRETIMAGQVRPERALGAEAHVDAALAKILARVPTKTTDALLSAIAEELERQGIRVLDSTMLLKETVPSAGALTTTQPTPSQWEDIRFGVRIVRALGAFDIGQTVVVKERAVLAVEAMEGTDAAIQRGGTFSHDVVVVKLAKPSQDMRFDVPVIGPRTIATLAACGAACLAVEAGRTVILDREHLLGQADRADLAVVALGPEDMTGDK